MPKKLYLTVISFLLLFSIINLHAETNVTTLANYFDLLVSGNIESAHFLWTDEARERAERFGIEYENIPLKIDCYSPIVKDINGMRDYLQPPVKQSANLPLGYSTLLYSAVVSGQLVEYTYYMRNINDYFWLTFPQEYYSYGWKTKETKYFRIRYDSTLENQLNPIAIEEADNFIDYMAKQINLPAEKLNLIQEKKIEYFFCASDKIVEEITGHLVKGTYDMPSNDIISAFFPHYHELVHLLVNVKLQKLPLYALPLLREGVAVHYGGRWGKSPKTLQIIGEFLISEKMVVLDSILSFDAFNKAATSNIAYSVAGLFSGYLIEKIGTDAYFQLYRDLSGNFNTLMALSTDELKQKFLTSLHMQDWETFQSDFRNYLDKIVAQAEMTPGITEKGTEIYNANGIVITVDKEFYNITALGNDQDTVSGNILFHKESQLENTVSSLFEEQYQSAEKYSGYQYGIRFDRNEAGVYDYATNSLIAKYIWSLKPSDAYYSEKDGKLYFKFRKDVLPLELDKKTEFVILPN